MREDIQEFDWIIIVNTVMAFISIIPFGALAYLCILHIYLFCKNKSTLELIMESRKKTRIHPSTNKEMIIQNRVITERLNKKSYE